MGSQSILQAHVIDERHSIFGGLPKEWTSTIDKDDHTLEELDTSEELPIEGLQHYQSLISVFQWVISLVNTIFIAQL
jgi:hypothetical protein